MTVKHLNIQTITYIDSDYSMSLLFHLCTFLNQAKYSVGGRGKNGRRSEISNLSRQSQRFENKKCFIGNASGARSREQIIRHSTVSMFDRLHHCWW